jgi:hypothetical protein
VLDLVHARLQRVPVVVIADLDRLLEHDGTGVDTLVDEEHGDAGHFGPVRERVGHRLHTGEGGQQRRVHVQTAAGVALEDRRPQQAHVPGRDHDVDAPIAEEIRDRPVEVVPVGEVSRLHHGGFDAGCTRAIEGLDAGAVRKHERDQRTADGVIEEGLQVRPGAGNEHRDPFPHGRGTLPEAPSAQAVRYRREG